MTTLTGAWRRALMESLRSRHLRIEKRLQAVRLRLLPQQAPWRPLTFVVSRPRLLDSKKCWP